MPSFRQNFALTTYLRQTYAIMWGSFRKITLSWVNLLIMGWVLIS